MGNYRQHITFASVLGAGYAGAAFLLAGIHWLYGSVAWLLATMAGLLPDLDSDSGVQLRGLTGLLGVLMAVAVWDRVGQVDPPLAFEVHLWVTLLSFLAVRHGLRRAMARLTVHRGMSHSLPTCAVWGAITYLYYPSDRHVLRLMMALAVMLGFFSHLLLDEICSVDLRGIRVNRAFGTAMKLWARSIPATLAVYLALSYLAYRVIEVWPEGPVWPGGPELPNLPPMEVGRLLDPASWLFEPGTPAGGAGPEAGAGAAAGIPGDPPR